MTPNPTTVRPSIRLRTLLLAAVFLFGLISATTFQIFTNPHSAYAGSDTYPAPWAPPTAQDSILDTWKEWNRECTSYAAWMLHSVNGFEMPFNDDASGWGTDASNKGYTVNMTPAVGSIFWSTSSDHVAWVESVSPNGTTITTEDYNSGYPTNPGWYAEHTGVATSSASGYIHFKDILSNRPATRPATLSRASTNMDTFYQSGSNLIDRYWDSTIGWNAQSWGDNIASAPAAITRTSSSMDVFFRNSGNNLVDRYWNPTNGWNSVALTSNGTMRGNPTVIARDANHMDVFYRDSGNNLVDWYWNSTNGWNAQSWGDSMLGNPAALTRGSDDMQVFFRNTGKNLVNRYWSSANGWNAAALVSNGSINGDPGVVSRDSSHMDVFYQDGNANDLYDRWWDANLGWNTASSSVVIAGTPSAVSRNSGSMEVFVRSNGNNLVDQWWTSSLGWNTATLDNSGKLLTDPLAIYRDASDTDVFYGESTANLIDEYYNSTYGWNQTYWGW